MKIDIFFVMQVLKEVMPIIIQVFKAIYDTQAEEKGKDPDHKENVCKMKLENDGITEEKYKYLPGMIKFGKELLREKEVL